MARIASHGNASRSLSQRAIRVDTATFVAILGACAWPVQWEFIGHSVGIHVGIHRAFSGHSGVEIGHSWFSTLQTLWFFTRSSILNPGGSSLIIILKGEMHWIASLEGV